MRIILLSSAVAILHSGTFANTIDNLDTLSVTATRTERKVQDVPASITVITEKEIANAVATSADELLKEVAGVDMLHTQGIMSTGTTNKLVLRGFGGTETRTLLLVDGVPMNDSYFAGVEWNQIPVNAIKRIEVVKGAGSALYGSNAMGGVINIITKSPDEQKSTVDLGYGSMNTKIGAASTTGKTGNLGYFLSGQVARSDGYVADTEANIKDNTIKRGTERENAIMKVSYDLDKASKLQASYNYLHNQSMGVFKVPGGYNPYEQKMQTFQADYTRKFDNDSDMKLTLFQKTSDSSYDSLNSDKLSIKYQQETEIDELGGTLQYTYPLDSHILTAGIDVKLGDAMSHDDYITTSEVSVTKGKQDYYGIFLQDEMFLGENFVVNLGGRFDHFRNHSGSRYDETTALDILYEPTEFDAFSPKLGAVYSFTDDASVRASIGKAFRAPTVYDLYRTWVYGTYVYASNPDLKPETVLSYELGVDYKLGSKGLFSVTGYYNNAEDFIYTITPDPAVPNEKEKVNVGKVIIKGIETELNYRLAPQWKAIANYTYNESKIDTFTDDTTLEGNYLTESPKHKGSLSVAYQNQEIIDAKATVRYVGERYNDDKNTEDKMYDSYTLVDLKLARTVNDNVKLELSVSDLFDKGYTEYYVSPGRVVMGTAKLSF